MSLKEILPVILVKKFLPKRTQIQRVGKNYKTYPQKGDKKDEIILIETGIYPRRIWRKLKSDSPVAENVQIKKKNFKQIKTNTKNIC